VVPKELPEWPRVTRIRTWSSGSELIGLSETDCDICSFVRKYPEQVSITNLQRLNKENKIVLQDCHNKIALSVFSNSIRDRIHGCIKIASLQWISFFNIKPIAVHTAISVLKTPCDPVLHACELLEACVLSDKDEHHDCNPVRAGIPVEVEQLPRRLLDILHDDHILTLDVQTWINTARATVDQLSDYCTLTYRWGEGPPDCMLSTEFTGEKISSFESLPQTFKDAIIVARALKIRFIWIDAMCIVQPSAHGDFTDWNAEGPRMWLVYQNAICNIAATCSNNPDEGFLSQVGTDRITPCRISQERENGATQPMFLPLRSTGQVYYASVFASSLNRRGWVAQERLLSRRILHFTEERVFWECQASDATNDDYCFEHPSLLTLRKWLFFIEFYSMSGFTQLTDRLIALSSIARSVPVERFGTTYFAGIWGEHLVECLSWRSEDPCSVDLRRRYLAIAPSWSWASFPDGILYPDVDVYDTRESLINFEGVYMSRSQPSNPYGNMEDGALQFCARIFSVSLPEENKMRKPFEILDIEHVSSVSYRLSWDELQHPAMAKSVYHVVPLRMTGSDDAATGYFVCLVVELLPSASDKDYGGSRKVYRRIGWFELCVFWDVDEEDQWHEAPSDVLLAAMFPDITTQTIVVV
jgi:hypothetical protein